MIARIIDNRGTGKTKELIWKAYTNNGILVCQNERHMKEKAASYGIHNLDIISYRDFIDSIQKYPITYMEPTDTYRLGYRNEDGKRFYIDELEGFVNFICLNTLGGYTLTKE